MNNKVLAPEHLQFINNYLENSGVKYLDIRYEMTDHVATALENREGDFMKTSGYICSTIKGRYWHLIPIFQP